MPNPQTNLERAAARLGESVTRNTLAREDRALEALQGIGYALLAIAERLDAALGSP